MKGRDLQNQAPNMVPSVTDILLVSLSSPSPSLQILLQKKPITWPRAKTAFSKIQVVIWESSSTPSGHET